MKPAAEIREYLVARALEIKRLKMHLMDGIVEDDQLDRIKKEYREEKIRVLSARQVKEHKKYLNACKGEGIPVEPLEGVL